MRKLFLLLAFALFSFSLSAWNTQNYAINSNTSTPLYGFPVYLEVNTSGSFCSLANCSDIRVNSTTDSLNYSLEPFGCGTNHLGIWFNVSNYTGGENYASGNQTITVYCGNSSVGDFANGSRVWDSNFWGVYHAGQSSSWIDDTINARTFAIGAGAPANSSIKYGNSTSFNGASSLTRASTGISTTAGTISTWINSSFSASNYDSIAYDAGGGYISLGTGYTAAPCANYGADEYHFVYASGGSKCVQTQNNYLVNQINHLAATWNSSQIAIWVNGVEIAETAAGALGGFGADLRIGYSAKYFKGDLDEYRISTTYRGPTWIKAEAQQQYWLTNGASSEYSQSGAASVYELNNAVFSLNISNASITSLNNVTLRYSGDGNSYSFSNTTYAAGGGTFNFTTTITTPLVSANSSSFNWNWTYVANGMQRNTTSLTQAVSFAYWINNFTTPANITEGLNATLLLYTVNQSALASTTTTYYGYFSNNSLIYSGSGGVFNIGSASQAVLENRPVNASYNVSYNGSSRITNAATTNVSVYRMVLTNCSTITTNQTLVMYLMDESTGTALNDSTVYYNAVVTRPPNGITRAYNLTFANGAATNSTVCLYPQWDFLTTTSSIYYSHANYNNREYYAWGNLSGTTSFITLYLLGNSSSAELDITVKDYAGNLKSGYIVQVQRYYPTTNSYVVVAQGITDYAGLTKVFLDPTATSYKVVIEDSTGTIQASFSPVILTSSLLISVGVYAITFTLNQQTFPVYGEYGQITGSCAFTNSTGILSCTVSDPHQLGASSQLIVKTYGPTGFAQSCNSNASTATATLTCSMPGWNNTFFNYQLTVYNNDGSSFVVDSGSFDYRSSLINWGSTGFLLTIFTVIVFAAIGAWNPVVSLFLTGFALIISYMLGAFNVAAGTLIGLLLVIGLLIWKSRG